MNIAVMLMFMVGRQTPIVVRVLFSPKGAYK